MSDNKKRAKGYVSIRKVTEIPTNEGKLGERNGAVVEEARKLQEGEIFEVTLEEGTRPQLVTGGIKYALKRVEGNFKVRTKNGKVYVKKEKKEEKTPNNQKLKEKEVGK